MRIVVADSSTVFDTLVTYDFLKEFGEVTVYDFTTPEQLPDRIKDADMVLCNKTVIGAAAMDAAPGLRYIGLFATGYNIIDVAHAKKRGIAVCNVPNYSTQAVAQHTVALILALTNRATDYNATLAAGDWERSRTFGCFPIPLMELSGKTLGIVGYGAIGRRVAEIAQAFQMRVVVYARHPVDDSSVEFLPFEALLKCADVVTMHCPLNDDSRNIMNEQAFATMKQGAIFVNTARGGLVDEQALREALDSGHLLGAGIDVLREEPIKPDCPLYGAENCIITPHIAWAGVDTRRRLMGVVANNIRAFLNGAAENDVTATV